VHACLALSSGLYSYIVTSTVLYFFFWDYFCLKQQVYLPAFTPHNNGLVYQITYIYIQYVRLLYVFIKYCLEGNLREVLLNMQCSDNAHKTDPTCVQNQITCIYTVSTHMCTHNIMVRKLTRGTAKYAVFQ
jgi:hypothetical protein